MEARANRVDRSNHPVTEGEIGHSKWFSVISRVDSSSISAEHTIGAESGRSVRIRILFKSIVATTAGAQVRSVGGARRGPPGLRRRR
jgi:hypothetical protein